MQDIVIVSAARTAVGKFGGSLAKTPATELGALVIKEALARAKIDPAQVGEVITISEVSLSGDSATVATVVDRQFVENQPLNGRSFQTLVELSPGVVVTPSNLVTPGQFSVNGQRAGSNYFTVDGVSANFGSSASTTLDGVIIRPICT